MEIINIVDFAEYYNILIHIIQIIQIIIYFVSRKVFYRK